MLPGQPEARYPQSGQKQDEALKMWKRAIQENPRNQIARKNLKECTNQYNEPAAPSPVFNDLYHFQRIQTERYFQRHGIEAFASKEEAERVLDAIRVARNRDVASRGKKLDTMTAAEKTELLKSIKVDF